MIQENAAPISVELATELTIAWLSNPNTRASASATEVPEFLKAMHLAVDALIGGSTILENVAATVEQVPAVTARRSLASKDTLFL